MALAGDFLWAGEHPICIQGTKTWIFRFRGYKNEGSHINKNGTFYSYGM